MLRTIDLYLFFVSSERNVYNNLIDFVGKSLSDCQFGFRSTLQQLLIFVNSIANSLNTGSQADVIYLDFKKAFDSVAHNELLLKLGSIGITDSLWLWLCAYLTNRLQCVSINGSVSDVLPVISGVYTSRKYFGSTAIFDICK